MWYSVRRVCQRIWHHKFLYFVLIFELAVGITFITYASNHFYSAHERQVLLEKSFSSDTFALKISKKNAASSDKAFMPITYNDYQHIQSLSKDRTTYYVVRNDTGFTPKTVLDLKIVYTDKIKEALAPSNALYGSHLVDAIRTDQLEHFQYIQIKNQKLTDLESLISFPLEPLPSKYDSISLPKSLIDREIILADCILLPLNDYKLFKEEDLANFMLYMDLSGDSQAQSIINEVLDYLRSQHGKIYHYSFYKPLEDYVKSSESLTELSRYFARMAVIMLLILLIGFRGLVNIFIKKREKSLAISMALGASKKALVFELFLEIFVICQLASILGVLVGNWMTLQVEFAVFDLTMHFQSSLIGLLIGGILSLLIPLSSLKRILTLRPVELLKSL